MWGAGGGGRERKRNRVSLARACERDRQLLSLAVLKQKFKNYLTLKSDFI